MKAVSEQCKAGYQRWSPDKAHPIAGPNETPHEVARRYGFVCRSSLDGYFIREKLPAPGFPSDDLIKIGHDGKITLCVPDQPGLSQAYLCAIAIKSTL